MKDKADSEATLKEEKEAEIAKLTSEKESLESEVAEIRQIQVQHVPCGAYQPITLFEPVSYIVTPSKLRMTTP